MSPVPHQPAKKENSGDSEIANLCPGFQTVWRIVSGASRTGFSFRALAFELQTQES
jgi:hypothetical protein